MRTYTGLAFGYKTGQKREGRSSDDRIGPIANPVLLALSPKPIKKGEALKASKIIHNSFSFFCLH